MKTIFYIARAELRTLFYSPIAWLLLIVFMIQCGNAYLMVLEPDVKVQALGPMARHELSDLTFHFYTGFVGLFRVINRNVYLYVPLLTMGLISREISSGTLKLLYSSPVKIRQIVLGKYLGIVVYILSLMAIIGVFVVSGIFQIKDADIGLMLSAAFGTFLLVCAYSAIGLYMSSLTGYQVVAALCTFVTIGILGYIGGMWQDIPVVRNLTFFLSLTGHTEHMLDGLISTNDVLYFVLIIVLFISFSISKLTGDTESRSSFVKAGRYLLIVVSTLLIGYISSIPGLIGYYDATANKINTLAPNVQEIVKEMGGRPLEITAYDNLLDGQYYSYGSPESYNGNIERWAKYRRFEPGIKLNTVLYYDTTASTRPFTRAFKGRALSDIAVQYAEDRNLKIHAIKTPEEIRKIIDLKEETAGYIMQLKYNSRSVLLRLFDDQMRWPSENEVAAAFKRLVAARIPKVTFLTGNYERNIYKLGDREYKTLTSQGNFRYALINQGFDVDTLSLKKREIPSDVTTLVIADPKVEMDSATVRKIRNYISSGGNLLIAGEPGKQKELNPLLQDLGVELMPGTVAEPSAELSPDLVLAGLTPDAAGLSRSLRYSYDDSLRVSMPGVTGLYYAGKGAFSIKPLLVTDGEKSWLKKDLLITDSAEVKFSAAKGDERGSVPTVVALSREINGKEQRIVVAGDADFMSNAELFRYNIRTANFSFNMGLFSWLSYGEFPIDAQRSATKDNKLKITVADVSILKIVYTWMLPALLFITGGIFLLRRKRK